ncbi:unnamed protein product [Cylindrotheca closterium]|uniref:Uncharacterized protein n=1 Tax=Cylindrotheca closterium TaxID=2856 RepID=A0AAD2CQQ6_9STRA|nr:unnamed protein product [Cylindrotheca closterium]
MKHQRTPIMIEDYSDDENLSLGPLRKRQKRTGMAPALTLESLIRAGEALKEEDKESELREESPRSFGCVTPTHEHQDKAEDAPLYRKLVQTALSDSLAALEEPKCTAAGSDFESSSKDWRQYCRPLSAPPRLPNVPFGFIVSEKNGLSPILT